MRFSCFLPFPNGCGSTVACKKWLLSPKAGHNQPSRMIHWSHNALWDLSNSSATWFVQILSFGATMPLFVLSLTGSRTNGRILTVRVPPSWWWWNLLFEPLATCYYVSDETMECWNSWHLLGCLLLWPECWITLRPSSFPHCSCSTRWARSPKKVYPLNQEGITIAFDLAIPA